VVEVVAVAVVGAASVLPMKGETEHAKNVEAIKIAGEDTIKR
jgi:hypothetical protein